MAPRMFTPLRGCKRNLVHLATVRLLHDYCPYCQLGSMIHATSLSGSSPPITTDGRTGQDGSSQFLRAAGAPGGGRGPQRHAKIDYLFFCSPEPFTKIFSKRKPRENLAKTSRKPCENLTKASRKPHEDLAINHANHATLS